MIATQKPTQNGTSTKPIETPTNGKQKETSILIAKPPVVDAIKNEEKLLSFDEKFNKLNILFDLQKKYLTLKNSQQKLLEFQLKSNDENGCYLTIKDDNRNEFTTYNTSVIIDVMKCLSDSISLKIKELETKLTW